MTNSFNMLRWVSRVLATLLAAIILVFAVGEGFNPFHLSFRELLLSIAFLILWSGLIVGWFREKAGGLLIIAGWALFYVFNLMFSHRFPRGWFMLTLIVPGILYLLCDWFQKNKLMSAT